MEKKTYIKLASNEHFEHEFQSFMLLRRRIRKWIKNDDRGVLDIYNIFVSIINVFTLPFIKETIMTRYNADEREIIYAMMTYHGAKNLKYDVKFLHQLETERDYLKR